MNTSLRNPAQYPDAGYLKSMEKFLTSDYRKKELKIEAERMVIKKKLKDAESEILILMAKYYLDKGKNVDSFRLLEKHLQIANSAKEEK